MVTTRRARPDLTDSWADVDDDNDADYLSSQNNSQIYNEEDERREMADEYRSRLLRESRSSAKGSNGDVTPRRRNLRSSVEPPELVMPASPDGDGEDRRAAKAREAKQRASTPHFRLNERSLTSDAGSMHYIPPRSSGPRSRMNTRSMTSDAGRSRGSRLQEQDEDDEENERHQPTDAVAKTTAVLWQRIAQPLLGYTGSVMGLAVHNAKPILGWLLLFYALAAAFVFASNFVTNSFHNALSPICRLPFTSNLAFCPDQSTTNKIHARGAAEFGKLVHAQDAFQDILAGTAAGVNLPLDMKRSEAGIRDLKHVVQYSKLDSRNELVFEFTGFIDTARQASSDLSRFNSRIGRAVDHILSTNRWTLSVIDGVAHAESSRGSLSHWMSTHLDPFAALKPLPLSRDVLLDQYLRHTSAVEDQILSLITEAHALRSILDNLDSRLDVIANIAQRDGVKLTHTTDELFGSLWTKLGGNRASVAKVTGQLALLDDVGRYRRLAWGHVTATLVKLQAIQHSLEDLRERVAMPEVLGTQNVPLEVHIQSINLGIERLELQREEGRKIEREAYQRVVSRGEQQKLPAVEGRVEEGREIGSGGRKEL